MKRKCKCGETHNFQMFKTYKTTWRGRKSYYQFFCKKLKKLMILVTDTYPFEISNLLCPQKRLKKFSKTEWLIDSDQMMSSNFYGFGAINIRGLM